MSALAAAGIGLFGCVQQADEGTKKKLEEISAKIDALDKKVAAGGGRPQQMQPPQGPDPAAVYAVPIEGSAYRGPENAKVTIVEAFEFA